MAGGRGFFCGSYEEREGEVMSKESRLRTMFFSKDSRVIKDSYRERYDKMFGKRDIFHHTRRSGKRIYRGFDKKEG